MKRQEVLGMLKSNEAAMLQCSDEATYKLCGLALQVPEVEMQLQLMRDSEIKVNLKK